MASEQQVKEYLAYWLQLGKRIIIQNGEVICGPIHVLQGHRYSPEFEKCWAKVMALEGRDCYIEGTTVTLQELLSSGWDIHACARCQIPVGSPLVFCDQNPCPCSDLMHWPNDEAPVPHLPVNNQPHFANLRNRLQRSEDDVFNAHAVNPEPH
jgi:hypothetical protein